MIHRKKLQIAVASLFIAALCLAPVASASDAGSGSYASAGIFSMDGLSWLEAVWGWFTGGDDEAPVRSLDTVVEKGELGGFPPLLPEGGGMNNPNGGGGGDAGPGIDPDGKE